MKFILEYNSFTKANDPLSIKEESIQIPLIELDRTDDSFLLQWMNGSKKREIWVPKNQIIGFFDGPTFLPNNYNGYIINRSFYERIESDSQDKEKYKFFSEFAEVIKTLILQNKKKKKLPKIESIKDATLSLLTSLTDNIEIQNVTDKKIITDKGTFFITQKGNDYLLELGKGNLILKLDVKNAPFLREINAIFKGIDIKEKRKTPYLISALFKQSINEKLNDRNIQNLIKTLSDQAKNFDWKYKYLRGKERKIEDAKKTIMDIIESILMKVGRTKDVEKIYLKYKQEDE